MIFLLDHDVPDPIADVLAVWGHKAIRLRTVFPTTATDQEVFAYAQEHSVPIISCNRNHFLGIAQSALNTIPASSFGGLIILIRRRTRQAECANLLLLLRKAGESGIAGNINFA